ncbi:hypothetical protein GCM10009801_58790 [Streptomyces albiaxialis]|uniref:Uncharacterized protein n=1 Tax=Streptomyces albiaxialis TaxID=329523 RepID=A0ABN2WH60_9ACTN
MRREVGGMAGGAGGSCGTYGTCGACCAGVAPDAAPGGARGPVGRRRWPVGQGWPSGALCLLSALCALLWVSAVGRLVWGAGGALEASVAAGGWGLSLLPVHVSPDRGPAPRATDLLRALGFTTASRPRRWGAGSGRS